MLEVAIGDVCQLCSGLVKELESSGHPILDTLVKHVRPRPCHHTPLQCCACCLTEALNASEIWAPHPAHHGQAYAASPTTVPRSAVVQAG